MESYRTDWGPCRTCGTRQSEASNMFGGGGPSPGSINICVVCNELSIIEHRGPFGTGYRLRELTDEELLRANRNPQVIAMRAALIATRRKLGPPPSAR